MFKNAVALFSLALALSAESAHACPAGARQGESFECKAPTGTLCLIYTAQGRTPFDLTVEGRIGEFGDLRVDDQEWSYRRDYDYGIDLVKGNVLSNLQLVLRWDLGTSVVLSTKQRDLFNPLGVVKSSGVVVCKRY